MFGPAPVNLASFEWANRLLRHRPGSRPSPEIGVIGNAPGLPRLGAGAAQHYPAWVPVMLHGHVEVGEAGALV